MISKIKPNYLSHLYNQIIWWVVFHYFVGVFFPSFTLQIKTICYRKFQRNSVESLNLPFPKQRGREIDWEEEKHLQIPN